MIKLENRGIIKITGKDSTNFLNNILTNNIDDASEQGAVFAALLSPQGRYLFDMFIIKAGEDEFLLDTSFTDELFTKLMMYKLRSNVKIEHLKELSVYASFENETGLHKYQDPRNNNMGLRIIDYNNRETNQSIEYYNKIRIQNSIPELEYDLLRDKDFALEGLLDEMGAIDFHKGCYIGQEMTSRMKRRGTLKQKLVKINFLCDTPPPFNSKIMSQNNEIGLVRSVSGNIGLALVRLDRLQNAIENNDELVAEGCQINVS